MLFFCVVMYDLNRFRSFSIMGIISVFRNLSSPLWEGVCLVSGVKNWVRTGCSSSVSDLELVKERCLMMDSSKLLCFSSSFERSLLSSLSECKTGFGLLAILTFHSFLKLRQMSPLPLALPYPATAFANLDCKNSFSGLICYGSAWDFTTKLVSFILAVYFSASSLMIFLRLRTSSSRSSFIVFYCPLGGYCDRGEITSQPSWLIYCNKLINQFKVVINISYLTFKNYHAKVSAFSRHIVFSVKTDVVESEAVGPAKTGLYHILSSFSTLSEGITSVLFVQISCFLPAAVCSLNPLFRYFFRLFFKQNFMEDPVVGSPNVRSIPLLASFQLRGCWVDQSFENIWSQCRL